MFNKQYTLDSLRTPMRMTLLCTAELTLSNVSNKLLTYFTVHSVIFELTDVKA